LWMLDYPVIPIPSESSWDVTGIDSPDSGLNIDYC
jgi:hypothetical protein